MAKKRKKSIHYPAPGERINPLDGLVLEGTNFTAEAQSTHGSERKGTTADDAGAADRNSASALSASLAVQHSESSASSAPLRLNPIWTLPSPSNSEKIYGKHPTQKPVALIERCLLASTAEGDLVLDPFLGNGTTAVAAAKLRRRCVGIEEKS